MEYFIVRVTYYFQSFYYMEGKSEKSHGCADFSLGNFCAEASQSCFDATKEIAYAIF